MQREPGPVCVLSCSSSQIRCGVSSHRSSAEASQGVSSQRTVPLHLRNARTRLMKEMGYGKGYIYPPGQSGQVEQEYMPPSLQGHKFLLMSLHWQDL